MLETAAFIKRSFPDKNSNISRMSLISEETILIIGYNRFDLCSKMHRKMVQDPKENQDFVKLQLHDYQYLEAVTIALTTDQGWLEPFSLDFCFNRKKAYCIFDATLQIKKIVLGDGCFVVITKKDFLLFDIASIKLEIEKSKLDSFELSYQPTFYESQRVVHEAKIHRNKLWMVCSGSILVGQIQIEDSKMRKILKVDSIDLGFLQHKQEYPRQICFSEDTAIASFDNNLIFINESQLSIDAVVKLIYHINHLCVIESPKLGRLVCAISPHQGQWCFMVDIERKKEVCTHPLQLKDTMINGVLQIDQNSIVIFGENNLNIKYIMVSC